MSEDGAAVQCSNGISLPADSAIGPLTRNDTLLVCSGLNGYSAARSRSLDAIRRHIRQGGSVGGICTGAYSLARVGILSGKRVTLHWENLQAFVEQYPYLEVSGQLFEIDGLVITCGGGVSSVDMMLALIATDHGTDLANMVADMCVLGMQRNNDTGQRKSIAAVINTRNPSLIEAVRIMNDKLEDKVPLCDIALQVNLSNRQLERLFNRYLGTSPAKYYKNIRLDFGRSLVCGTELAMSEIAFACGFRSTTNFTKNYRDRFGENPCNRGSTARYHRPDTAKP
nr:GlxA family transcriptional regulator [Pseudohalocynthiibacter aestuariivivens]